MKLQPSARLLLIVGVISASLAKIYVVSTYYAVPQSLADIAFEFGPRILQLLEGGTLEFFSPDGVNTTSLRMPFVTVVVAALSLILGDSPQMISIVKTVFFDVIILLLLLRLFKQRDIRLFHAVVLLLCVWGPQFWIHSYSISYEEGFTVYLMAIIILFQLILSQEKPSELFWLVLYTVLNGCILLAKSSMILLVVWNFLFLVVFVPQWSLQKRLLAVVAGLMLAFSWTGYLTVTTGQFHLGTSFDGMNLYNGHNEYAYDIYPPLNLDRLHNRSEIEHEGRRIILPNLSLTEPEFDDVWDRDAWYKRKAVQWIYANPVNDLVLTMRKIWVMFFEVRNTPIEPDEVWVETFFDWAGVGWMLIMRLLFFATLGVVIHRVAKRQVDFKFVIILFGFLTAYSAPYVVGFAYERHAVMLFMPSFIVLITALSNRNLAISNG